MKQGFVLQIMIISNLHYSKQSCIKTLRDRLKWLKLFKDRPKKKLVLNHYRKYFKNMGRFTYHMSLIITYLRDIFYFYKKKQIFKKTNICEVILKGMGKLKLLQPSIRQNKWMTDLNQSYVS